jgi:dTDP-4-dehydrorhamnose reductase
MQMKTILVTGSNGQLGWELQQIAPQFSQYKFLFTDRATLDITNESSIETLFTANVIDACINCAAYTAVDKAETDTETCFIANSVAPTLLAEACKKAGALFVHISTDYVFDGTATVPYKEDDEVNPQGVYGASKLDGEMNVLEANDEAIIIRTSWVYSSHGINFVKRMMQLMNERESLNIVNDQLGTPTYATDLAKVLMQIVAKADAKNDAGIYHYSNEGLISWYDFAVAIKEMTGSGCVLNAITTDQYPTPAKRPAYSVLDKTKIKKTFGLQIPDWQASLQNCMALLLKN